MTKIIRLMTGVKTNIVTSVEITGSASNDSPHLPALARKTAERFANGGGERG